MSRAGWLVVLAFLVVAVGLLLRHGNYGWTLFAVLPVLAGWISVKIIPCESSGRAAGVGAIAAFAGTLSLLAFGLEGAICVLMALPLAVPLGAFGGWLAHGMARPSLYSRSGAAMMLVLQPVGLAWDVTTPSPLFEVKSAVEISAPPEVVWQHVVSFSDLPEPDDWFFKAGLAYPRRARIEGSGPGAIRYCEFSTGPFVEPIEVWDEPRLLQFRVTENPAPMREWTPYGDLMPKHLHGYMVSERGQFQLTRLPGNRTRLEGTTWYRHGLLPAQYWRVWSDAIIHRIHLRVLNHIRTLSEPATLLRTER